MTYTKFANTRHRQFHNRTPSLPINNCDPVERLSQAQDFDRNGGARSFTSTNGCKDLFITARAPRGLPIKQAMTALWTEYLGILTDAGTEKGSAIYLRFYLSDIANDAESIVSFLQRHTKQTKYFLIGQPPADGSKIAIEAYHLLTADDHVNTVELEKKILADGTLLVQHKNYQSFWWSSPMIDHSGTNFQTKKIYQALEESIHAMGGSMADSLLRTWVYVRDIDNNYAEMVARRREFFAGTGLSQETHFVASTGIEGQDIRPSQLVRMDAMGMLGLSDRQVTYLSAPENMCPTSHYGVTFERGTKVTFGDRCHYYISGTASIDKLGRVVHPGDVVRQMERTLENIEELLVLQGAILQDLRLLTVYLRDPGDLDRIKPILQNAFKGKLPPCTFLRGAVCRPTWLVEAEGFASTNKGDPHFPPLL